MITYQVEMVADVLEEMKPMLIDHFEETEVNQDKIKLDPDYDQYLRLERNGAIHLMTVREDGRMIGYYLSFLMPHIHHRGLLMSFSDLVYIRPYYRTLGVARELFLKAEESMRDLAVKKMHVTAKTRHDFGPMLKRIGYNELEKTYDKVLM